MATQVEEQPAIREKCRDKFGMIKNISEKWQHHMAIRNMMVIITRFELNHLCLLKNFVFEYTCRDFGVDLSKR